MPDERPESGYDWLYGKGSDSRPTTVQPTTPRGNDLPPPNLPPPGGSRGGGGGRSRPPRRSAGRRGLRTILILILAWIVFLVAVPLWAWTQLSTVDADPEGDRPEGQPGATYLLVGSDSRKGLTKEERKDLTTGKDSGGRGRTDTILILHTGDGPSLLLSIPRDSLVPIEGYGTTKINAAYAFGGPELLVQTIEQSTGLEIDDYVEIGFGGLVKVVDGLGGVEICPKKKLKDKDAGLDIGKGCQNADGKTALAYSRTRKAHATGDIQRGQSQREVLGGIAGKGQVTLDVHQPGALLPGQLGRGELGAGRRRDGADRARAVRPGALVGHGRRRPQLHRSHCRLQRPLGPRARPQDVRAHQERPHRRDRQPLHEGRPAEGVVARFIS